MVNFFSKKKKTKEEKKEIIPIITENEIKLCASHNFSWPKTQMQVFDTRLPPHPKLACSAIFGKENIG